ncbi:unnamed protein product [Amaranthus hypochondriacus]
MEVNTISQEGSSRGRGKNKRFWTCQEDSMLIKYLHQLSTDPKWKGEGGFKNGYMSRLEELINGELPSCGLKAFPHIESRIKHWSEKYSALAEMLSTSGFGWDADKKMLQVERAVFDEWAKVHKKAKGLYGVPFPHYDIVEEIYAKDKATGDQSESFVEAINCIDVEVSKKSIFIDSDEEDDADSRSRSTTHSIQFKKRSIKQENDNSTSSKKPKLKELKGKKTLQSDVDKLVSSFHEATSNFEKIFDNINVNLGTMANAWAKAEEREQKMDEKVNKVLEEVMKLDGISPSEVLEVATILIAEKHKLRIFYQAHSNLKKQYVLDLLKKK